MPKKNVSPRKKGDIKPKPTEELRLTKVNQFYIENNQNKTDVELSKDLSKPIELVKEHIHKTKSDSRVNKLLIREKGCVIMTEGASVAGDESRKKNNETDVRKNTESYIHYTNKE